MKIFIVLSRVPYPLEKGDKLRAYHQINYLARQHEVHLCCLSENRTDQDSIDHLKEICSQLHIFKLSKIRQFLRLSMGLFSDLPFQVIYFYQSGIHKKISKLIEDIKPDQIYAQLIRSSEYVKNEHGYPKMLDYMDAFSKGIQRRMKGAGAIKRMLLSWEYKRLQKYENLIFDYFERHSIISEPDRELIYHPLKNQIHIIPNGVDLEYFKAKDGKREFDLLFTGNMGYPPNINCAKYIAKKLIPLLKASIPNIRLLIAGAQPSKEILDLKNENIEVSGWMDDIRDAYNNAKIFLAPMQIGTGLQNKLLEAMAMNLPCISSPLANAALGAEEGKDILIGNNAEQLTELCVLLLNNPEKQREIANNGYNFVQKQFDWSQSGDKLIKIMQENKSI